MTTGRHLVCENLNIKIHFQGELSFIVPSDQKYFQDKYIFKWKFIRWITGRILNLGYSLQELQIQISN